MIGNLLKNIVGGLLDFIGVPYVFGENSIMAHLNTSYEHVHGKAFKYPSLADAIVLTSSGTAWVPGAFIELIPENGLDITDKPFDLHWMNVADISGTCQLQIDVYSGNVGSEVFLCSVGTQRTSNFSREGAFPLQIPQQEAGKRISCKLSSSENSVRTCGVFTLGHYYGA